MSSYANPDENSLLATCDPETRKIIKRKEAEYRRDWWTLETWSRNGFISGTMNHVDVGDDHVETIRQMDEEMEAEDG